MIVGIDPKIDYAFKHLFGREKRILYYACKLHQQQLHEGHDYLELKPTISINFLDHIWFPRIPDHHLCFRLFEQSHGFPLTEDLRFHILELPKFTKSAAELTSGLDIWLYFLRHAAMMDTEALPAALQVPLVLRAFEELKLLTQTDQERKRYEARRKAQLDDQTRLKVARLEGREEGEKIGIIHFCEGLLNRPETPAAQLASLSIAELTRLADELRREALKQK